MLCNEGPVAIATKQLFSFGDLCTFWIHDSTTNTLRNWEVFLAYRPPSLIPNHLHFYPLGQPCINSQNSVYFQQQVQITVVFCSVLLYSRTQRRDTSKFRCSQKLYFERKSTIWKGLCTRSYLTSEWENSALSWVIFLISVEENLAANVFSASLDVFLFCTYICRKIV